MRFNTKFPLLVSAACVLAAALPASRAYADTFLWNNSTYTYNAAQPTAKTTAGAINGNTISVQFGNGSYFNTSDANSPSPAVGGYAATAAAGVSPTYADGGTGSKALQIFANFDNAAGNIIAGSSIPVTVFFSRPVSGLIFSFHDVDGNNAAGGFEDSVTNIFGLGTGGGAVPPISLTNGSTNAGTLGATSGSFTANGTAAAQNSPNGDATVTFGNTPITQFTFTYTDPANTPGGTAHSATQIISLGNLTFTTVPEPSTWACFVMAGGLGVWTLRRRARRQV